MMAFAPILLHQHHHQTIQPERPNTARTKDSRNPCGVYDVPTRTQSSPL